MEVTRMMPVQESFQTNDLSSAELNGAMLLPVGNLSLEEASGLELPWEVLSAMIQGRSSIDLTTMPVYNREQAMSMIYNYGFDLTLPEDRAEMESYFIEAVNFIEHRFLHPGLDWVAHGEPPSPRENIPKSLSASRDVVELLLVASQKEHPHRLWACALLKVMHTLVYIQNSPLYKYHAQASETILSRFQSVLQPEKDGNVLLSGRHNRKLNLYTFEAKRHKPRESILIKLLCKKENVAENVWDLVGVRLVTFHPAEAILAVDILREAEIILFPNVIPSRSRNTLIDFAHFRELYERSLDGYKQGKVNLAEMQRLFETDEFQTPLESHADQNPLSSPQYRSLHITCRQLLRLKSGDGSTETRFAFPYEVQILDKVSYLNSKVGQGAHASYKQRQLFAARRRVLGSLLDNEVTLPTNGLSNAPTLGDV
jgi:uncharacterized protein (TIGR04562 family)